MDVGNTSINNGETENHMTTQNKENLPVPGGQHGQDSAPSQKMMASRSFGTPLNTNSSEPRVQTSASVPVSTNTSYDVVTEESTDKDLDKGSNSKRKRRERTTFTKSQINFMNSVYIKTKYPDATTRESISKQTGIAEQRIQVWFKNRRAKGRKYCQTNQNINDDCSLGDFSYDLGHSFDINSSFATRSALDGIRGGFEDSHSNLNALSVNLVNPIHSHLLGFQNYVGTPNSHQPSNHFDSGNQQPVQYTSINTNQLGSYHPGYVYRPVNFGGINENQNQNVPNMYLLNNPNLHYSQLRVQHPAIYRPSTNTNNSNPES